MKIAKRVISVFLLVLLCMQTNYLLVYYALFEINRDALTAEMCVEREKNCNACCYLDKKMSGEEGKADPVDKTVTRNNLKVLEYIISRISIAGNSGNTHFIQYKSFSSNLYNSGYLQTIDHPPKV